MGIIPHASIGTLMMPRKTLKTHKNSLHKTFTS